MPVRSLSGVKMSANCAFESSDAVGTLADALCGDFAVFYQTEDEVDSAGHDVGVVAAAVVGEAQHVGAGVDGQSQHGGVAIVLCHSAHGHVVGDDDAVEVHAVAQQGCQGGVGESGGHGAVDGGVEDVGSHNHPHLSRGIVWMHACAVYQCLVWYELVVLPGVADVGEAQVGVAARAAVSGEVLEASCDSLPLLFVDPYCGALRHATCVVAETAFQLADDGAGGVDVDVDAGCEVEVDAHVVEGAGGELRAASHAVESGACRRLCRCEVRESVLFFESADASAFLVDADEEGFVVEVLQVVAEFFQLLRRADVAWPRVRGGVVFEEDDAADVVLSDVTHYVAGVADGGAAEADEEHLCYVVAEGGVAAVVGAVLGVAAGGKEEHDGGGEDEGFHGMRVEV